MSKLSSVIFLILLIFSSSILLSFRSENNLIAKNSEKYSSSKKNYNTYCVGCHGINLEDFTNRTWKNGKSKSYLIKTITKGYPDGSMPGSENVLSKKEIKEMAEYIISGIQHPTKNKSGIN